MIDFDGSVAEPGRVQLYDPGAPPPPPKEPSGMAPWLLWTLVLGTAIVLGLIGLFVLNSAFADPVGGCGGG